MSQETEKQERDEERKAEMPEPELASNESDEVKAAEKMLDEGWGKDKTPTETGSESQKQSELVEKGRALSGADDRNLRESLEKLAGLNGKNGMESGDLNRFASFFPHINGIIKEQNSLAAGKVPELDAERFKRVLETVDKCRSNEEALDAAIKSGNKADFDRLLKEQQEIKKLIESKEFRKDLEDASNDLRSGFNVLRSGLASNYDGLLKSLVDYGRKLPLEQMPQDLPVGLKGFVVSNEQFKTMVEKGEFNLPERSLADHELPTEKDLQEVAKLLRFTDAATQELNRGKLETQWNFTLSKLQQLDASGELAKKWFPEKLENLSDAQIEKKLAAAAPWIEKGLEVHRYAELHHRLGKMINDQFTWPSWLGGIPSNWDSSAIENHKDLVSLTRDDKTARVTVSIKMPESLDRNDANSESIRQLDEWLKKYKEPVDQVLNQIDASKAENSIIYWGDIKAESRVDRDGNLVEAGWKDAAGNQVFQESDGRKYRISKEGEKEWVPADEKLTDMEYRIINGNIVPVKEGEEIRDVNLMRFRTEAKEVKGPDGQPLIEIKQVQNLQYAHWLSYQGWGWVSDVKTMGGDIKAQKIDKDQVIGEDKGVAGHRRDGKAGDYLVTLADGRQQFIEAKSFEKLYREKAGKPGEYEEKPRQYKPDDWLVVYRTDSGIPQPTLMQAKDVPAFVSSQEKWQVGTKVVTTLVDAGLLLSGVAEVKAAMVGVQAAAGTAAAMSTMRVLGKALLTNQGAFGALHAGIGITGFMGQGIENIGPAGKTFMHLRAIAMIADLGYTAIGRPFSPAPFVPTAEQIAGQGLFSRALLNFNSAFNEVPLTQLLRIDKAASYLSRFELIQKAGTYLAPFSAVGRLPGMGTAGKFIKEASFGRAQALGADVFFLSDIGFRQIPGIVNRAHGTDSQAKQQEQALERRWLQSTLPEDRKSPSSFDKQTMLRMDAFKQSLDEAIKIAENDPKRIDLNKKLIETVKSENADARDRFAAAFALVELNSKDGRLPEKISAADASIDKADLQKFIDSQRYLQAKEVIRGYQDNLKVHVAAEFQSKLDKLAQTAKLSMSDNAGERETAMSELIAAFQSPDTSPEEKLLAASSILFARRRGEDGQLAETVSAGGKELKAKDLVDFLHTSSLPRQGYGSDSKANPGHMRLYAGDMLLRLDIDRFSIADMNQICLAIVNDKNQPADPAAKERFTQLKLQAMTDAHGLRLGDLYELMKSRVEPEIAAMAQGDHSENQSKGMALASIQGRDAEAIQKALSELRQNPDKRVAALASYMLYAVDSPRASERVEGLARLQKQGDSLKFPVDFNKDSQEKWAQTLNTELLANLKAELPAKAGEEFDRISWNKFRAAEEFIASNPDLKSNPQLQNDLNKALMSLINGDNPQLAAKALPLLLARAQSYTDIFSKLKADELSPELKNLKEVLFDSGAILDTLAENSIDMLMDSATYATYSSRVEGLYKDLDKMRLDYASEKAQLSETDRAGIEGKIQELESSYESAKLAPLDFKKALLANLALLGELQRSNPLNPNTAGNAKILQKAVEDLSFVNQDKIETMSPDLRVQAIKTLSEIASDKASAFVALNKTLREDPSPSVRLAAIDALAKLTPENLQAICLEQLRVEKHPEVAKRLREVEFTNRRPDPDSYEYKERFDKARIELINQAAHSLTGAEDFIISNHDLKFLDGQTLRIHALTDLQDMYFNGVGGFFRFAWEGEKGVDSDHAKLLDKYAGYMRNSMDALGRRAATDDEALKALVYIGLSNGRPLLKDDRSYGAEQACEKLRDICKNSSPERAKQISWAVEMMLLHQPNLSAKGRQAVLDGLKSIIAKPGQGGLSDSQVSTLLASTLQRQLKNTPAADAKDFAAHEKLQLDLLNMLGEARFASKEILPVLEAISEGSPKFKVLRNSSSGEINKVQFPDGSSREVQTRNGQALKFIYTDSQGKETVWLPDPNNLKTWYNANDKERKEPWKGEFSIDQKNGDYISFNAKSGLKTVIKPNGGKIESIDGKVARLVYPDGSIRAFDPPGDGYKKFTFTSADGKRSEVWERDGASDRFYRSDDKEKKNPWVGQEHIDEASGDYVQVQGEVRNIFKLDGSKLQVKNGAMTELRPATSVAYNTSIDSVRLKAQELLSKLADQSVILRQQAVLPDGFDSEKAAAAISLELANPNANSEKVGRALALSEKLAQIKSDDDPRRAPLAIAARDGHELVRLIAARQLAKSSNADDRALAYSVLSRLEKQGSRQGYVAEAHELITQMLADKNLPDSDRQIIESSRSEAARLNAAEYKSDDRTADISSNLDYQDNYERATRELKDIALKRRNLAKYDGSDNWFSKSDNYNLLDADKLRAAQKQAAHDAYPGPLRWLFMSRASIDKVVDDAVNEVWNKQDRQLAALGEQAKLQGESGREAREALASIILTQGQPLKESDRVWAMREASKMIRDCIKGGHPGSRDMLWVLKAALIEEPSLDQTTRFNLMNALSYAKDRGIIDSKEASIVMAAALESEYQGMPAKTRAAEAHASSIVNQKYAIDLLSIWGNAEASPVLDALSRFHPDPTVRQRALESSSYLKLINPLTRVDGRGRPLFGTLDKQQAFDNLSEQILELERIRLRLPAGTSAEQIKKALVAENR